jgi:hypothetical protein
MSATTSLSVHAMRKIIRIAMVAAILIGVGGGVLVVRAQDQARARVLGVWEGTLTFGATAPAVMEFTQHGETIKWTCRYRSSDVLWGDVEGTVTAFSPPTLEATGVYTKHAVSRMAGTGVKLSLILDGDHMKGTLTAEMNSLPIDVSLARKK